MTTLKLESMSSSIFPVSFTIMQFVCIQIIICNYKYNMQMCPLVQKAIINKFLEVYTQDHFSVEAKFQHQ